MQFEDYFNDVAGAFFLAVFFCLIFEMPICAGEKASSTESSFPNQPAYSWDYPFAEITSSMPKP